jgi:restriction system protein
MKVGHDPNRNTNKKLIRLLKEHFGVELEDTYATNLFPFIKAGNISTKIPLRDLRRAAEEFALPQIKIVRPKLVVCLGLDTFKALCLASGRKPPGTLASAIQSPFSIGGSMIWCQAHQGGVQ